MFYTLSKLLGVAAALSSLLALALAIGLALALRRRGPGLGVAAAALALLFAFGLGPLGGLMCRALEQRFPPWAACGRTPAGVVVLDGATQRLAFAMALAHRYPQARIIYSGRLSALPDGGRRGVYPGELLAQAGIAPPRLQLETRSRDTYENALYSKALARPRPGETWLVLTSAFHMPRAIGAFRAVGFPVEAYPVDYRTPTDLPGLMSTRLSDGLGLADISLREMAGLLAYTAAGRSAALWPAPPTPCGRR